MNLTSNPPPAAMARPFAAAAVALCLALALSGCYPRPHACDDHGGIRSYYYKAHVYRCGDGSTVSDVWLLLHHREVAP